MEKELSKLVWDMIKIINYLAVPLAVWRLGNAFLDYMTSKARGELGMAIRQVIIAFIGINGISAIIWFGLFLGKMMPTYNIF